jgi:hypothetical protein
MSGSLVKYRFSILCLILFVLMVLQAINGQWAGDFGEHAAVASELATHPFILFSLCPRDCFHLSDYLTEPALEL